MKKVFLLVMGILMMGVSHAGFSDDEHASITAIVTTIEQAGEQIDAPVALYPTLLARSQEERSRFVQQVDDALDPDAWSYISDYEDFMYALKDYIRQVVELRKLAKQLDALPAGHDAPAEALIMLQQHLWNSMSNDVDFDKPIQESGSFDFAMDASVPFVGEMDMAIEADIDARYDLGEEEASVTVSMAGEMQANGNDMTMGMGENSIDVSGQATIDVLVADDTLYIGLDDVALEGASIQEGGMVPAMFGTLADILDTNYVALDMDPVVMMVNPFGMTRQLVSFLTQESLVTFGHHDEATNTYYGIYSTQLCDGLYSLGLTYEAQECLEGIVDIAQDTDSKGIITLTINRGNYSLGFSDMFVDTATREMMDDAQVGMFTATPRAQWTSQGITSIHVPLDVSNAMHAITYTPREGLAVNYSMQDAYSNITIQGQKQDGHDFVGTATIDVDGTTVTIQAVYDQDDRSDEQSIKIVVSMEQGGVVFGTMTMDAVGSIKNINNIDITPPTNTISGDELDAMMETAMEEYFQEMMPEMIE